ncbi:hypothetical protein I35_5079 [Burkholderia cenocepacia H111]|nr:hypothetical protein I35_5079 [Burkholderia cenocepacia H111]
MPDRRTECFARNVPCSTPSISPCFCAAPGTPARHCAPQRCNPRRDGRLRCAVNAHGRCCAAFDEHSSPACHECAICTAPKVAGPRPGTIGAGGPARARRSRPWGEVPSAAARTVRRGELSG